AMAQDEPAFPEKLAYTLNGQKELAGVTAEQTYDKTWNEHNFSVTGTCDADQITIEFETPDGWDGIVTAPSYAFFGKTPKTRGAEDWDPLEMVLKAGWTESNSITFDVDGMEHTSSIMFIKGDQVYSTMLGITFNVNREGGVKFPEYPESLSYTLNGAKEIPGVTVTQEMVTASDGEDHLTIHISGKCEANELTFEMVTPEGWNSMLVYHDNWSGDDDDDDMWMKAKAPAKQDDDFWMSLMYASFMNAYPGNSITFPADGDEYKAKAFLVKGDKFYTINIDIISDVNKADEPKFPERLDFTMNGEKELEGVEVTWGTDSYDGSPVINVTGTCDADAITFTFATPEGWDGFMISAPWGDVSTSGNIATRSESDWSPKDWLANMDYKPGNSVTFNTGEDNDASIALVWGDKTYNIWFALKYDVSKKGSDDPIIDPVEDPVFPESFVVDTFLNEGIEVDQYIDDDWYIIALTGEANSQEFSIVIDVPEGWDGFISANYSSEDIKVEESGVGPRKTRAESNWISIDNMDQVSKKEYVKGNKFTFPANGELQELQVFLYKGDMVDIGHEISLENREVTAAPMPEIPASFDVELSCEGLEVEQGPVSSWGQSYYGIMISGECPDKKLSVTLTVPEGWDGFVSSTDEGIDPEIADNTRASYDDYNWYSLEDMYSEGYKIGNKLTFSVDGEEHEGSMFLYKGNEALVYPIQIFMNAMPGEEIAVPTEFPSTLDLKFSCEGPTYRIEPDPYYSHYTDIYVEGECSEDEFTITVEIPEGWEGIYSDYESEDGEETRATTRAEEIIWEPISDLIEDGCVEGNTFKFKTGEEYELPVWLYLYRGNMYDDNNLFQLWVNVGKGTGVNAVESATQARYYNLQGVEVSNPTSGTFVKVVAGKASMVGV
ncbi:MAG: hypothetical protein K2H49_05470, partial [Muribaculaceae bacterium]|nr:hypothetical protein [Muribaculaceae bacterium]